MTHDCRIIFFCLQCYVISRSIYSFFIVWKTFFSKSQKNFFFFVNSSNSNCSLVTSFFLVLRCVMREPDFNYDLLFFGINRIRCYLNSQDTYKNVLMKRLRSFGISGAIDCNCEMADIRDSSSRLVASDIQRWKSECQRWVWHGPH